MKKNRFKKLLSKFINKECSQKEEEELAQKVVKSDDLLLIEALGEAWAKFDSKEKLSIERSREILAAILAAEQRLNKKNIWKRALLVATSTAAILIILLQMAGYQYPQFSPLLSPQLSPPSSLFADKNVIVYKADTISLNQEASYLRNILLPDGSHVVLKAGSRIELHPDFAHRNREVYLVGEAYFDIKPRKDIPFVINTGKLKTKVLGTAFNIAAWPKEDQIRVTVTRGKVQVEDEKQIFTSITDSEEMVYRKSNATAMKRFNTNAQRMVVEWAKKDMDFTGMSIGAASVILSQRFHINIDVIGDTLSNELIVASFNGTESLATVLHIISVVNPFTAFYTQPGKVTVYESEKWNR